jgi:hypothetical protein
MGRRNPVMARTVPSAALGFVLVLGLTGAALSASGEQPIPAKRDRPTISLQDFRAAVEKAGIWEGGPLDRYEAAGRVSLATSIRYGLMPHHRVLDVGAGSLRIGWWFLQYIEPSNYHAIEPVRKRLDGATEILGVKIHRYYNDDWEFPEGPFDFVFARSIWTHASKGMIAKMLAEFAEHSSPDAVFLTSFLPALTEEEDYKGDRWVGTIESDRKKRKKGVVRHSLKWILQECAKHALLVEVGKEDLSQTWLAIRRAY